jgi:DNA-binding LacI/PurR family transcriptional regulator
MTTYTPLAEKITVHTVAERAGVSPATVSRVLNQKSGVASSTRRAVVKAAREVKFRTHTLKKLDALGQLKVDAKPTIGFIVNRGATDRPVPSNLTLLIDLIEQQLREQGLAVQTLIFTESGLNDLDRWSDNFEGFIVTGNDAGPELRSLICRSPSVWMMSGETEQLYTDQVLPDHSAVAKVAADYLHQRGCRRPVIFQVHTNRWIHRVRAEEFRRHAAMHDLSVSVHRPDALTGGGIDQKHWEEAIVTICRQITAVAAHQRCDGIFFENDIIMSFAIDELHRLGFHAGQDYLPLGCDHEPIIGAVCDPPPATIDLRFADIAFEAAARMRLKLSTPSRDAHPVRICITPQLITPETKS